MSIDTSEVGSGSGGLGPAPFCGCGALLDRWAAAIPKSQVCEATMTLQERSNLVLAFARVLYINGQSTDQTLAAAERLGDTLGLRAKIMPRWG